MTKDTTVAFQAGGRDNILNAAGPVRVARTRRGFMIYHANDIYVGRALARYGEHHEATIHTFEHFCKPGDTVIDAGANIGNFTVAFGGIVGPGGRVISFEPQRVMFQILCGNVAVNNLGHVDCYQMAVAARAGELRVPELDYSVEDNFGGLALDLAARGRRVPAIALDGVVGLERCDFVKIDVEGMELDALIGATALIERFRPTLFVENHRTDKSPAVLRHLFDIGYRPFWHFSDLYNPDNFTGDPENVLGDYTTIDLLCLPNERPADVGNLREARGADEHPYHEGW